VDVAVVTAPAGWDGASGPRLAVASLAWGLDSGR